MTSIQAIIFDLEGTIIDTESIWDEAQDELLGRRGHRFDHAALKHQLSGGTLLQGVTLIREHYGFKGEPEDLAIELRSIFEALLKREVTFIPGFSEFYEQIRPHYATAIATSMERLFLKDVDARLHLTTLFKGHIYSIEDIGFVPKPEPDIFLHAAARLGVPPAACLVIEDAPKGIQGALAAGMRVVALTTTMSRAHLQPANQVVDHYSEIVLS